MKKLFAFIPLMGTLLFSCGGNNSYEHVVYCQEGTATSYTCSAKFKSMDDFLKDTREIVSMTSVFDQSSSWHHVHIYVCYKN